MLKSKEYEESGHALHMSLSESYVKEKSFIEISDGDLNAVTGGSRVDSAIVGAGVVLGLGAAVGAAVTKNEKNLNKNMGIGAGIGASVVAAGVATALASKGKMNSH